VSPDPELARRPEAQLPSLWTKREKKTNIVGKDPRFSPTTILAASTDSSIVTIIGGGAFAPRLCEALARAVKLPAVQLRLSARREDRLRILAEHSARRVAAVQPRWTVRAASSLEDALSGSTVVILLVRVGGFVARDWDETFPRRFGLVGDEGLGPGGIANAWRTLPELGRISQVIQQVAPDARIVNLMAPLGVTTRLLLDQGLNAFGLCELPLLTIESWLEATGHSRGDATWRYAGLNHLGWFWDVQARGEDVLLRLTGSSGTSDAAPIDTPTVERYHAAPLRYFYEVVDRDAGRRLGIERSQDRARHLLDLTDTLVRRFSEAPGLVPPQEETRPTPWLDRAVAPVVSSLLDGLAHDGFVNIKNGTLLPELPHDLVVEVAARFSANGVRPVTPGPLPAPVAKFLQAMARAELLTFDAAAQRNSDLLVDAIRALPLPILESEVQHLATLAEHGGST
jgi:6-phospho-beta-glucosidase